MAMPQADERESAGRQIFASACPYPPCSTVEEVLPPKASDFALKFEFECEGCRRPRVFLYEKGRVVKESEPRVYGYCSEMRAEGGVSAEIADLLSAATDYLHRGATRGAAVLVRVGAELFLAHQILRDPTDDQSLDRFKPMIDRVRAGEGVMATEVRDRICDYLGNIMALGDTAAHPRIYPQNRQRPFTTGNVLEDLDHLEEIVRLTTGWGRAE
ncbi:MAG: hypothetical protein L3K16_08805 [Thermoplasmata archaeon]|nr:hypothetical protein [Thermoplasmata archaeon]